MAVDMFMKIAGIDGESADDTHKNWIDLSSYSCGVSQSVSAASATGGRTVGKADFQDFTVVKVIDSATSDLNKHCADGTHVGTVEVDVCVITNNETHVLMKYTMEDCIVSSVSVGGMEGDGGRPTETVTLNYGTIEWEYTPIDEKGSGGSTSKRGWDLRNNKEKS